MIRGAILRSETQVCQSLIAFVVMYKMYRHPAKPRVFLPFYLLIPVASLSKLFKHVRFGWLTLYQIELIYIYPASGLVFYIAHLLLRKK
uniref:Uncharacterized protein n=1 Tax=Candidatus Berkiella cookevillensis TaxID=437022 RepID=A0A0Q9YA49_9GAMM